MQPIYIKGDENHIYHFTRNSHEYPKYNYLDKLGNSYFATKNKKRIYSLMNPANFTFTSKDGLSLFGRAWVSATKKSKGIIHLIHGLGEHSGRYDHIGKALAQSGYHLAAFDLRGHGLSEGPRGHSPGLSHLLDDISIFLDETKKHLGNSVPIFLYGHSMGGNLVINFGIRNSSIMKGAIVTSPALQILKPQPKIKVALANYFGKRFPRLTLKNGIERKALSRNAAIVKAYQDDVYVHDKVSARLGLDLLESGSIALKKAQQWDTPLLLMHGTADRLTSWKASKEFAQKAGDLVELIPWEDYYHELHNDFGSEKVINKMVTWLDKTII
jgi:alpha-beta hydrolase superfamily lysophospholipase